MIKTIIFDFGGVYFTNGTKDLTKKLTEEYNLDFKEFYNHMNGKLSYEYRLGLISCKKFWSKTKEKFSFPESVDELNNLWLSGYKPINGTVNIIKNLYRNNYELLYLSDNTKERVEYLEKRYCFLKYFKDGIFSYEVKLRKPDIEIYNKLLSLTNSSPSECLFIDDKKHFLEPARNLGMSTILFTKPKSLIISLKQQGMNLM